MLCNQELMQISRQLQFEILKIPPCPDENLWPDASICAFFADSKNLWRVWTRRWSAKETCNVKVHSAAIEQFFSMLFDQIYLLMNFHSE